MAEDAMAYLARVEAEAKRLYALSSQGPWEALLPSLQALWINHARASLRENDDD